MSLPEPTTTYLELRESDERGEMRAGLSHKAEGLVLLHVLELAGSGEPRGAATVVHDAGSHGARYLGLARALASRGWSAALPDLRGHGRSEGARGHTAGLREVLRDLGDVQDHLAYRQPEAPKVLVGHGVGALWALAWAAERADELAGLVLAAPVLEPRFAPPERKGGLLARFKKPALDLGAPLGWSAESLSASPEVAAERARDELCHELVSARGAEVIVEAAREAPARLSRLALPVLVVGGAEDPLAPAASLRSLRAPALELELLEGRRHELFSGPGADEACQRVASWIAARGA